jgi:hypothetical protein
MESDLIVVSVPQELLASIARSITMSVRAIPAKTMDRAKIITDTSHVCVRKDGQVTTVNWTSMNAAASHVNMEELVWME